jgi:addiction module RelE/StbE family toxin
MNVIWSTRSSTDLKVIVGYISKNNPAAAETLVNRILYIVNQNLAVNPELGRQGRVSGTRELVVHTSYIVIYTIDKNNISILSVRHTSQLWPEKF